MIPTPVHLNGSLCAFASTTSWRCLNRSTRHRLLVSLNPCEQRLPPNKLLAIEGQRRNRRASGSQAGRRLAAKSRGARALVARLRSSNLAGEQQEFRIGSAEPKPLPGERRPPMKSKPLALVRQTGAMGRDNLSAPEGAFQLIERIHVPVLDRRLDHKAIGAAREPTDESPPIYRSASLPKLRSPCITCLCRCIRVATRVLTWRGWRHSIIARRTAPSFAQDAISIDFAWATAALGAATWSMPFSSLA